MDEKVQKLMKILGITEAEALEVIATDKEIDRGAKLFELPDELKAGAKKARQAERKPTNYDFSKRKRKADNQKAEILKLLAAAVDLIATDIDIVNEEGQFVFMSGGRKYKVVLSCPRS